jgi:hypothetical protein
MIGSLTKLIFSGSQNSQNYPFFGESRNSRNSLVSGPKVSQKSRNSFFYSLTKFAKIQLSSLYEKEDYNNCVCRSVTY